ncbi:MAG: phytoene desaturase family protein [Paracoccaceae bacterium]
MLTKTRSTRPDAPDLPRLTGAAPRPSLPARPRAIVIGAGFGGLAAAVRLSLRGYAVTVLDRLDGPGGRGTAFRQDGFVFDAGPTIVTVPKLFEDLWTAAGERMADHVTLAPLDPFYRIRFDDGETFAARRDPDAMRAEVARLSPGDVAGFDRFVATARARYRIGFEGMGTIPFERVADMVPWLYDLARLRADRSVWGAAAAAMRDPRLRQAMSFHPLFIGGDPTVVTSMYCLVSFLEAAFGVHYAMGGTNALARAVADLAERQGAQIHYGQEVDEILVENGRAAGVRLASGAERRAEIVVSNADVAWTYGHLLRGHTRRRWTDARLGRAAYSMSLYVWYFGTDRRWDAVDHHTILMGPRYRELIRDIFRTGRLADDLSLYLHRPSATDPSVAPEGCDAFYVLAPVPHLGHGHDWSAERGRIKRQITERLEATVLPGLSRHIVSELEMTPEDFRDRYRSPLGAGFSLEPRLFQSAWFRPHNRSEELDGLYLVGAGTHPGAGLPGVVTSALLLDSVVPHGKTLV